MWDLHVCQYSAFLLGFLSIPRPTASSLSDGGSYLHDGWGLGRKPNSAPRLKELGKLGKLS
jgi:hypothetical protein